MLILKKQFNLSCHFDIHFSRISNLLFIKGFLGILILRMPSLFFCYPQKNKLSIIFLNRFFFSKYFEAFFLFV